MVNWIRLLSCEFPWLCVHMYRLIQAYMCTYREARGQHEISLSILFSTLFFKTSIFIEPGAPWFLKTGLPVPPSWGEWSLSFYFHSPSLGIIGTYYCIWLFYIHGRDWIQVLCVYTASTVPTKYPQHLAVGSFVIVVVCFKISLDVSLKNASLGTAYVEILL